ncbi:MAG: choice-of-anchor Q domain-containing protein [Pseudomonadota bacterium]
MQRVLFRTWFPVLAIALMQLLWMHQAWAGVLNVPADYPTIQDGIYAAVDGDTVVVAAGDLHSPRTYRENVSFEGKSITLTSSDPDNPEATIIDGGGDGSVVSLCAPWKEGDPWPPPGYPVAVTGFTIRNGNAVYGGGISCGDPGNGMDGISMSITIDRCHIVGNTATRYGGGISASAASLKITNCVIRNNEALEDLDDLYESGGLGGGVFDQCGPLTMIGCTVADNRAISCGGGVECGESGTFTDCTISGNSISGGCGCGVNCMSGTFTRCTISGNFCDSMTCGGGVCSVDPTIFDNCTVTGNKASCGGGICAGGIRVTNSTISENGCPLSGSGQSSLGGGIYCGSGTIANCTITNNSADWGGGLELYGESLVTNCTISGNYAHSGAGIVSDRNYYVATVYAGPDQSVNEGAVVQLNGTVTDPTEKTISNCMISGNRLVDSEYGSGGSGIFCQDGVIITNCTIVDNTGGANSFGVGLYSAAGYYESEYQPAQDRAPIITNCIFWGNTAAGSPEPVSSEIYVELGPLSPPWHALSPVLTYSDVLGGYEGTGNIDIDPLFMSKVDYHLSPDSPCIDSGTAVGAPNTDMDGNLRPSGAGYDMGAYEYPSGAGTAPTPTGTPTIQWTQRGGTPVTLSNPNVANPRFTAPLVGIGGETLTFELAAVRDGEIIATDSVNIVVNNVVDANHAPVADAGLDQTVAELAPVTLHGEGSSDPDGDTLSFTWTQTAGPAVELQGNNTVTPTFTAPAADPGGVNLEFQLTVDDGFGGSAVDTVVIHVQNANDPPDSSNARPTLAVLWPPDHKLVPIGITGVSDPDNDPVTIAITGVTQDEPVNGLGDGDTGPDAVIQGSTVLIRAERSGKGNGRVYCISFTATDSQGGSCSGSVTVGVPHDKKPGRACVDDGQTFDSTQNP